MFGFGRDVEQSRGQWRHAEVAGKGADDASDPQEEAEDGARAARLVQTALASRGTTEIRGTVWRPQGATVCEEPMLNRGSGQLSSSTRLVTARHVVEPMGAYDGPGIHTDGIEVRFETTDGGSVPEGRFVPGWDDNTQGPVVPHDHDYYPSPFYPTKFPTNEANPLLANRMAQLGMEELAPLEMEFLRGPWRFEADTSSCTINDDCRSGQQCNANTNECENEFHFDAVLSSAHLDISILRVDELSNGSFTGDPQSQEGVFLSSGSFGDLNRPGIFFDYKKFQSLEHITCADEESELGECDDEDLEAPLYPEYSDQTDGHFTKLWMLHHQSFPDSPADDWDAADVSNTTNLISNPFPYVAFGQTSDSQFPEKGRRHEIDGEDKPAKVIHISPYCVAEESNPYFPVIGDAIPFSLDGFQGSSGGSIVSPLRYLWGSVVQEDDVRVYPSAVGFGSTGGLTLVDSGKILLTWSLTGTSSNISGRA